MIKTLKLSDIIKNQAVLNVGCIGHVSNGKSTLVRQMTGIKTQKFKSEKGIGEEIRDLGNVQV